MDDDIKDEENKGDETPLDDNNEQVPDDKDVDQVPDDKKDADDEPDDKGDDADEESIEAKRKAYKERQDKRKQDVAEAGRQADLRRQADQATSSTQQDTDDLAELRQASADIRRNKIMTAAKREYASLEGDFKEAYPDYDEVMDDATEFVKISLMNRGMSEADAVAELEREKIMLADSAVKRGQDPVEVVYKEAQSVNKLLEAFAEKKGYVKKGKKKTNLQKSRELNKPNALQGGRGSRAVRKELMDNDSDDLDNMTLADMLAAKKSGAL